MRRKRMDMYVGKVTELQSRRHCRCCSVATVGARHQIDGELCDNPTILNISSRWTPSAANRPIYLQFEAKQV